ncbi:MAG: hypothetical protein JWN20_333, partial [Jatrophihabitantaceae bacterium]|nr:hypothetical protein [Jatrophihabitantaceae bacterium]
MTSPMVTVVVLAVLWLVVVVPMVLQRKDERADERSVASFGRAMALLGSRGTTQSAVSRRVADPADPGDATMVLARTGPASPEVFVSGEHTGESAQRAQRAVSASVASRRPVPVAKEALMHPVDRSEMSAARAQMLARRRRSLTVLGAGTGLSLLLLLLRGGALVTLAALVFTLSLVGYVWFLRTQAQRDTARRANRLARASSTRLAESHDAFDTEYAAHYSDTVVALDDDSVEFDHLDTVDLTGLYLPVAEPLH